jgi:hypothetical protein
VVFTSGIQTVTDAEQPDGSIALIVRVLVIYVAMNFGYAVIYTVAVPFFSTNLMMAVVNGIYVGLLFCVLRNKMILKEPCIERKNTAVL